MREGPGFRLSPQSCYRPVFTSTDANMQQPANDETFANDPCISVTLHARYLLALKNHRRQAFLLGMFWVCSHHSLRTASCRVPSL